MIILSSSLKGIVRTYWHNKNVTSVSKPGAVCCWVWQFFLCQHWNVFVNLTSDYYWKHYTILRWNRFWCPRYFYHLFTPQNFRDFINFYLLLSILRFDVKYQRLCSFCFSVILILYRPIGNMMRYRRIDWFVLVDIVIRMIYPENWDSISFFHVSPAFWKVV